MQQFSDKKNMHFLKPDSGNEYFYRVLDFVARVKPQGKCNIVQSMNYFNSRFQKRSLVFIISDLEVTSEEVVKAITKLIPFNHTIILINPFSPWFEIHEVELDPTDKALAEAISEEMMEHILTIKQNLRNLGVTIITCGPDDMLNQVLRNYLEAKKKGSAF